MNVLDCLLVLVRYRWLLVRNTLLVTALFLVISLLVPKTYRSTATLIPIATEGGGIASLLGGYSINIFGKNVIIPESYRVILNSQSLRDSLISEFNLMQIYGAKHKEQVYKTLDRRLTVNVDKEIGIGYSPIVGVNIHAEDKDPARAMDMANFCMNYLHRKARELNAFYVRQKFSFVEKRYLQTAEELRASEDSLRVFQEKHGVVEITEQVKAIVQHLAGLEAERERMELELGIMATTMNVSNPAYKELKASIQVLEKQISKLREGASFGNDKPTFFYATDRIPDMAMNYYRLYRDVQVGTKILEMLTVQYEQSKIQTNKDLPALLVLDKARLPTYKFKPKRLYIVLSGFLLGLIISLIYVFARNFYLSESHKRSEHFRKLEEMLTLLKSDFKRSQP